MDGWMDGRTYREKDRRIDCVYLKASVYVPGCL